MKKALIFCLVLSGCGITTPLRRSEKKLSYINVGDPRQSVLERIGPPDSVRGSKKTESGSVLVVDEYQLYQPSAALLDAVLGPFVLTAPWWVPYPPFSRSYWMQYIDGKLDRWGKAGDWQPDVTADVTVRHGNH